MFIWFSYKIPNHSSKVLSLNKYQFTLFKRGMQGENKKISDDLGGEPFEPQIGPKLDPQKAIAAFMRIQTRKI